MNQAASRKNTRLSYFRADKIRGIPQLVFTPSVLSEKMIKESLVIPGINLTIRSIVVVIGAVIVVSCGASFKSEPVQPGVTTALVVQINQTLDIPVGKTRVYIQDGVKPALHNVDRLITYCSVRMKNRHKEGEPNLAISPGQFEIIKVRELNDSLYFPATFVVSPGISSDFPLDVIFEVEMRLKSAQQPDVWAMYCARKMIVFSPIFRSSYYPKLADIGIALGNTVEIREP